jgi:hypothetical protein
MELDYSLYPDREVPVDLDDDERAEHVERLCRQFDFGARIESRYVIALRHWKDIFDRFPVLDSPAYPCDPGLLPLGTVHSTVQKYRLGNRNGRSRTSAKDDHGISRCERRASHAINHLPNSLQMTKTELQSALAEATRPTINGVVRQ